MLLKDALLDSSDVPIVAMWADKSLTIPNKAARKYFLATSEAERRSGHNPMPAWNLWDETFSRQLLPEEHPLAYLVDSKKGFKSRVIGLYDPETGQRKVFDCKYGPASYLDFAQNSRIPSYMLTDFARLWRCYQRSRNWRLPCRGNLMSRYYSFHKPHHTDPG